MKACLARLVFANGSLSHRDLSEANPSADIINRPPLAFTLLASNSTHNVDCFFFTPLPPQPHTFSSCGSLIAGHMR